MAKTLYRKSRNFRKSKQSRKKFAHKKHSRHRTKRNSRNHKGGVDQAVASTGTGIGHEPGGGFSRSMLLKKLVYNELPGNTKNYDWKRLMVAFHLAEEYGEEYGLNLNDDVMKIAIKHLYEHTQVIQDMLDKLDSTGIDHEAGGGFSRSRLLKELVLLVYNELPENTKNYDWKRLMVAHDFAEYYGKKYGLNLNDAEFNHIKIMKRADEHLYKHTELRINMLNKLVHDKLPENTENYDRKRLMVAYDLVKDIAHKRKYNDMSLNDTLQKAKNVLHNRNIT